MTGASAEGHTATNGTTTCLVSANSPTVEAALQHPDGEVSIHVLQPSVTLESLLLTCSKGNSQRWEIVIRQVFRAEVLQAAQLMEQCRLHQLLIRSPVAPTPSSVPDGCTGTLMWELLLPATGHGLTSGIHYVHSAALIAL